MAHGLCTPHVVDAHDDRRQVLEAVEGAPAERQQAEAQGRQRAEGDLQVAVRGEQLGPDLRVCLAWSHFASSRVVRPGHRAARRTAGARAAPAPLVKLPEPWKIALVSAWTLNMDRTATSRTAPE